MSAYIVTEGPVEAALMERLVRVHPVLQGRGIRVREAGGRSAAQAMARTILVTRREPVALVIDANTVEPEVIEEQRQFLEWRLGEAGPLEDWRLILVAPAALALLFQDGGLLRSLLPSPPSFEQLIRGCYEPRRILSELFAQGGEGPFPGALLRRLAGADLTLLWNSEILQPLEQFLLARSTAHHSSEHA